MALAMIASPTVATVTPVKALTPAQQRMLDTWRLRVGSGSSTFATVFEPELDAADNHELARLIGLFHRLVNVGALVADNRRRPDRYRAAC